MFISASILVAIICGVEAARLNNNLLPHRPRDPLLNYPDTVTDTTLVGSGVRPLPNTFFHVGFGHPLSRQLPPRYPEGQKITREEVELAVSEGATCDAILSLPLFSNGNNFAKHTSSLFADNIMTNAQVARMVDCMLNRSADEAELYDLNRNKSKISMYGPRITEDDVRNAPSKCAYFIPFLPQLSDSVKTIIGEMCTNELDDVIKVQNRNNAANPVLGFDAYIKYLPENYLDANGPHVVSLVESRGAGKLHLFTPKQLSRLLKQEGACSYINAQSLPLMAKKDKQLLDSISSKCFAEITQNISTVNMTSDTLKAMNQDVFAQSTKKLNASFFNNMTPDQVQSFHSGLRGKDGFGENFLIDSLSDQNLEHVQLDLLKALLKDKKVSQILGERVKYLHKDIFNGLSEEDASILKALSETEFKAIRPQNLSALLKTTKACQNIPNIDFDDSISKFKGITAECFTALPEKPQSALLVHVKDLPTDILSMITDDKVSKWDIYYKKPYTGLQLLQAVTPSSKAVEMFKIMSTKIEAGNGNHACASIKSIDFLKSIPLVLENMTSECYQALGFTLEEAHYTQFPRLRLLRAPVDLFNNLKDEDWIKMKESDFSALTSSKDFCKAIPETLFNNVIAKSNEKLATIQGQCYKELSFRKNIPSTIIPKLHETAFAYAEKGDTEFAIANLTDNQLAHLSESVQADDKSFLSGLTMKDLATLNAERVAKFTKKQFLRLSPDAFRGLDFTKVDPENMTEWKADQFSKVDPSYLAKMTDKQAEKVGSAYKKDDKNSCLSFLEANMSILSPEARAVVEKRANGASSIFMTSSAFLIATMAVIMMV